MFLLSSVDRFVSQMDSAAWTTAARVNGSRRRREPPTGVATAQMQGEAVELNDGCGLAVESEGERPAGLGATPRC